MAFDKSEWQRRYRKFGKGRAVLTRYARSKKGKAAQAKYARSTKRKASQAKYARSAKGKITQAKHAQSEKRKKSRANYSRSWKNKQAQKRYVQTANGRAVLRRNRFKYKLVYAARMAVGNAIRDGRLVRKSCEVCGDKKAHAHHDDYAKPLDVRWLCRPHHREWHRRYRAKNIR